MPAQRKPVNRISSVAGTILVLSAFWLENSSAPLPAQTPAAKPADAMKTLLQEPLGIPSEPKMVLSVLKLVAAPGGASAGAHQHPGPVFAYVLKGEIENQVDPDPPKLYRAGDVFYEPPLHAHRLFRNLSQTDPAELLIFEVSEQGQPLVMGVAK